MEERVVRLRASTILAVLGIAIAVAVLLEVLWIARQVVTWILIALFLALALNPAVDWFQRHGIKRRGLAAGLTILIVIASFAGLGALFVPTLRHAVQSGGSSAVLGLTGTALAITKGIITAIAATVTITFMTLFMLLEGPVWMERFYALLPAKSQDRWRGIGHRIYRTVGGYVTGNLFISVIAGVTSTLVMIALRVPYAVALGLLVAILDLIPLGGATIAAIIVVAVGLLHSVLAGIVLIVFFIVYQQIENHILQPVVYSRTVQLSPLAVLISVLIGAQLAGVLGALAAIPVAGALQVFLVAWLEQRRKRPARTATV